MKKINSNSIFGKLLKFALVYVVLGMGGRLMAVQVPDGKPHKFELKGGNFLIDGHPFKLVAGEIHPVRVLPEFWEDRIRKARAMGLNTVSIYVMWNRIEAREGVFDFAGANDIRRFARLCQENGLWLIVRPGPYIGSEWDWGGFPAWLRTRTSGSCAAKIR
jgi:beta-galactosidase GanA